MSACLLIFLTGLCKLNARLRRSMGGIGARLARKTGMEPTSKFFVLVCFLCVCMCLHASLHVYRYWKNFGDMENIVVPERILNSQAYKAWQKKWAGEFFRNLR